MADTFYGVPPVGTVDTNNSTAIPLAPSGSYVGTATDCLDFAQIHVTLKVRPNEIPDGDLTTAMGSMFVEFSPDATNWDISVPIVIRDGLFIPQTYIIVDRYFRIQYLNDGGVAAINALGTADTPGTPLLQTEFRLNSMLLRRGTKELGRTVDQGIASLKETENDYINTLEKNDAEEERKREENKRSIVTGKH